MSDAGLASVIEFVGIDAAEAVRLEGDFLAGLDAAGVAYEAFLAGRGWIALGFDSFAEWWGERVMPRFRALEIKPTRELAARVIEVVREEEQALPPVQRRTQQELAELAGVHRDTGRKIAPTPKDRHGADLDGQEQSTEDGEMLTEQERAEVIAALEPRPRKRADRTSMGPKLRRPLPDVAKEQGWALRRDVERIEKVFADDRFGDNKEKVAVQMRGHLEYAVETLRGLLDRITPEEKSNG